jgi:polyphosphate kinase
MLEKGAVIPQILKKDILLSYPYESIHPFLSMLQEASEDESVLSIHMTLYRLAKNSQVVEALVNAAENGKVVGVLVELNARFDEENNINWSRKLEEAGCNVTYGLEGLKVHSKLCLITRKVDNEIQYITQIGTGNYNEMTARLYTDLSIMTANQEIGTQTAEIFRCILMGETVKEAKDLLIAPNCLQNKVISMIEEEIEQAESGKDAYIGIKVNSLTDKKIIDKLIHASQAGVKIEMIIRGICCLTPGIPGLTDNIQIKSIVGRLLEHSRIYIASADFMTRNTTRRVEVGVPILDEELSQRIEEMFITMWSDNVKARIMTDQGDYVREDEVDTPFNSQEFFYDMAYKNARELN